MSDGRHPASETLVDLFTDEEAGTPRARIDDPEAFDVWRVDQVLSRGEHASVLACHNQHAPRIRAALKTPAGEAHSDPELRRQFQREAQLLSQLDHPHVIQVRNARLDHTPPFIEMPFIEGVTLEQALSNGPLPPADLRAMARGLCAAVAHMQSQDIHHRDIKPGNVLCGDSGPILIDFGLATTAAESVVTPLKGIQGTPGYLPPEWAPDTVVHGADWDRYALGVVLYECCTGRRAFPLARDRTRMEQLFTIQQQVVATEQLDPGPDTPPWLRTLVMELTHHLPERRQVDLDRVATDLHEESEDGALLPEQETQFPYEAFEDEPSDRVPARPPEPARTPPETAEPIRRGPRLTSIAAIVAVLAISGGFLAWWETASTEPSSGTVSIRLALELTPSTSPLPVSFRLDDTVMEGSQPPVVSPGEHTLVARVGEDCDTGSLPSWCAEVRKTFEVEAGRREHVLLSLTLPEVPSHPVALSSNGTPPTRGRVDDGPWFDCDARDGCTLALMPGPARSLVFQAGACPDIPCSERCPSDCVEQTLTQTVSFAPDAPMSLSIDLPPLVQARSEARSERSAPGPVPPSLGPAITVGAFQDFLRAHPEWVRGGAAALAHADNKYLPRWDGVTATHHLSGAPLPTSALLDRVSPEVYDAYCAARGGVARVEDGQAKLIAGRDHELRRSGASWVALDASGAERKVTNTRKTLSNFIVRCRR